MPRCSVGRWRVVRALVVWAACAAPGALALAACDPCAGVASCAEGARVGAGGQIVDRGNPTNINGDILSGATIPQAPPVAGVRVEVIPTGGVSVGVASAVATTDGTGWWHVSIPASAEGGVTADIVVTPPGGGGYRVHGVSLRASTTRGDGTVLGRWTHQLYLTKLGEIINTPSGARPEGARVTVVRRGGIEVAPTPNTRDPILTIPGGRFLYDVRPLGDGPVVVDVIVERDGLPPVTVRNVSVYPQYEWLPPNVDGALIFYLDAAGNPG